MPNEIPKLTRKFSRGSLRRATLGRALSTGRMTTVEEDLAHATAQAKTGEMKTRFSSYKESVPVNVSNAQILTAMSSLTEGDIFDQAPGVGPSASFASQRSYSRTKSRPSINYGKAIPRPNNAGDNRALGLASSFSSNPLKNKVSKNSMTRRLGARKVGITSNSISGAISTEKITKQTKFQQQRPQAKSSSRKGAFRSLVALFTNTFKIFQYILLFPEKIVEMMTRSRWTAQGRTVLITGASSGIGAEMARQYALQGANLVLVARTTEDLARTEQECRELGATKVMQYAADLSNLTSTELVMKQAIRDFGQFDVVVLNAGRCQGCYFEEIKDAQQIDQMIKLNFNGAVTCLHYLLPHVPKSSNSRIVVISSTAGIVAAPYQTIYSGTKHALTGFSNSLRIELANTYGRKSPKVCLVTFPEISGTKLNTNRMDMGAKLPPAKWYSWAGKPLPHAVHELLPAIAAGLRDFGQPSKFNIWRSLYSLCPGLVDYWVMTNVQRTHYRPLDDHHQRRSVQQKDTKMTPSKSWGN